MSSITFKNVPEKVSKSMKSNKSSGTKPEVLFSKTLWSEGYRGYRKNYKKITGTPDIYLPNKKIAIFINGCFWHRCPYCRLKIPKTNRDYWMKKFHCNIKRDERNAKDLRGSGFKVIVIWECQLHKSLKRQINRVKRASLE